jgi:hypothetical protein
VPERDPMELAQPVYEACNNIDLGDIPDTTECDKRVQKFITKGVFEYSPVKISLFDMQIFTQVAVNHEIHEVMPVRLQPVFENLQERVMIVYDALLREKRVGYI